MTPTRPIAPAEVAQGTLRLGSLFSGAGWLDLAIEESFGGVETAFVCDIEPGPCKVLAHRFPDVPNLGDITKVAWPLVRDEFGPIDIIAGGSPCQDISTAGRLAGMVEGSRSNLWVEMREAIRVLAPIFVVWENVGAARSTKAASRLHPEHIDRAIAHHLTVKDTTRDPQVQTRHRRAANRLMESRARRVGVAYPKPSLRALGRVLGDLATLGFDAELIALRAADVGAPHGRLRYFVLAADTRGQSWLQRRFTAAGEAPSRPTLGEPARRDRAHVTLLPTPLASDASDASDADLDRHTPQLRSLPLQLLPTPTVVERTNRSASAGAAIRPPLSDVVTLLPTPRATRGGSGTETVDLLPTPTAADGERSSITYGRGNPTLAGSLLPTPSVADSLGGHERRGGDRGDELLLKGIAAEGVWGPYAAAIARWEAIVGPAPAPAKPGRLGRPKLNPEFAAWMMGAAPGWITDVPGVTDNEALRMAGNGVVQQQAAAALELMIRRMTEYLTEAAA